MRRALAIALLLTGCTGVDLRPIERAPNVRDDKLELTGSLCTRSPTTRVSPLRVLFVVDSSESMRVTDPGDPISGETGRERAVRETWEALLENDPAGIRVGIVRFSAEAQSRTSVDANGDLVPDSYFTADRTQLATATTELRQTSRTTNYLNALSEAYYEMRTELLSADLESLPLSKYIVIFVSDGLPDEDSGGEREQSNENILAAIDDLAELAELFRVGQFAFHTAYISAGAGPALDREAQELLQAMSERGNGSFRSFPGGESLNFLFVDLTVTRRVFTLRSLTAMNLHTTLDATQLEAMGMVSASTPGMPRAIAPITLDSRQFVDLDGDGLASCGEPLIDTDGDGLSDAIEARVESEPAVIDSDDDGLTDRTEWQLRSSGMDLLDPTDGRCFVPNPCDDRNRDGQCDCVFDLNANGMCDCAEGSGDACVDDAGHDCVDQNGDRFCDCPDRDRDGKCDYADRDGDGLHDCEEVFFGTARNGNDTDADGLPDRVEVRFRSSAVEEDREADFDWDRANNGTEVRTSGDPWCDDTAVRSRMAYRYELDDLGLDGDRSCYAFRITNVTLVPTAPSAAGGYPGDGWNRVLVYAGEVAFDDPDAYAAYRVACVMARFEPDGNYREPASGRARLRDEDFVDVEEFDADLHCRWP